MAKAESISARDLNRAVDRAVKLALARHDVSADKSTIIVDWRIIGRLMRLKDMQEAFDVAARISKGVELKGIKAQPACAKFGDGVLVGFLERAQLPVSLEV